MKTAQKNKIVPILFLLWALPISTLPRVAARPVATARTEASSQSTDEAQVKLSVSENYGKLPLRFEPNMGQSDKQVNFLSRGNGYTVFLTPAEAVFSLRRAEKTKANTAVVRMKFVGANANTKPAGKLPLQGKVNYLIGNESNDWRTDIP